MEGISSETRGSEELRNLDEELLRYFEESYFDESPSSNCNMSILDNNLPRKHHPHSVTTSLLIAEKKQSNTRTGSKSTES